MVWLIEVVTNHIFKSFAVDTVKVSHESSLGLTNTLDEIYFTSDKVD